MNLMTLPRYRSHKEVEAAEIVEVARDPMPAFRRPTCRGSIALGSACDRCDRCEWERETPAGRGHTLICKSPLEADPIRIGVRADYVTKHAPKPGGYYVRYADGYESFSPAEAFVGGYSLIDTRIVGQVDYEDGASMALTEDLLQQARILKEASDIIARMPAAVLLEYRDQMRAERRLPKERR